MKNKKLIIIIIAVLVLVVTGILVYVFVLSGDEEKEPEPLPEIAFKLPEMYTNIPVGDEENSYKILKLQMTIMYTNPDYASELELKKDEIQDFVNGYFRDKTLETINRKNGKERVKEEIKEGIIEYLGTDETNITKILFPQFITQ